MMGVDEYSRRGAMPADHLQDPAVAHLREVTTAPFLGRGHPQDAQTGQPVDHGLGDIRITIDRGGIDVGIGEGAHRGHRLVDCRSLALGELGVGKERLAAKFASKQRLGKTGAGGLGKEQLLGLLNLLGPQGLRPIGRRGRYRHRECLLLRRQGNRVRE